MSICFIVIIFGKLFDIFETCFIFLSGEKKFKISMNSFLAMTKHIFLLPKTLVEKMSSESLAFWYLLERMKVKYFYLLFEQLKQSREGLSINDATHTYSKAFDPIHAYL